MVHFTNSPLTREVLVAIKGRHCHCIKPLHPCSLARFYTVCCSTKHLYPGIPETGNWTGLKSKIDKSILQIKQCKGNVISHITLLQSVTKHSQMLSSQVLTFSTLQPNPHSYFCLYSSDIFNLSSQTSNPPLLISTEQSYIE